MRCVINGNGLDGQKKGSDLIMLPKVIQVITGIAGIIGSDPFFLIQVITGIAGIIGSDPFFPFILSIIPIFYLGRLPP